MGFLQTPPENWWEKWLGLPYQKQGRDPVSGLDCWGLNLAVWAKDFGFIADDPLADYQQKTGGLLPDLMRFSRISKTLLPNWQKQQQAIPGAAVLFLRGGRPAHVGLVTGSGYFLHTAQGQGSRLLRLDCPQWKPRFGGYFVPA